MLNYLAVGADEILLFNQSFYKQYYNGGGVWLWKRDSRTVLPSHQGWEFIYFIYTLQES